MISLSFAGGGRAAAAATQAGRRRIVAAACNNNRTNGGVVVVSWPTNHAQQSPTTTNYNYNNKAAFLSSSTSTRSKISSSANAPSSTASLSKLCQVNLGILRQKLSLIEVLKDKFGLENAKELYKKPCPLVGGASIGQHIRHSVDHIEKIVHVLSSDSDDSSGSRSNDGNESIVVRYDIRTRGGADEHDIDEARKRIERIMNVLQQHVDGKDESSSSSSSSQQQHLQTMKSCFMLSGSESQEYELDTTIGRELGFVVHHAIHHLALVKVIVTQPTITNVDDYDDDPRCNGIIGLSTNDLPTDFGTAPSTINYNNNDHQNYQQ